VNGVSYTAEPTLGQLVSGLVSDTQLLLRQELALAKHEVYEEVRKTKSAAVQLGIGIGLAALGGLLLIIMLVHALNALTQWPLWVCYGVIGGLIAVAGAALLYAGKRQLSDIDLVPLHTLETMKENARWIKEKANSEKI
jgi:hypothetical protein